MPRWPETWFWLCNLMLKRRSLSFSCRTLGSHSPQSNIVRDEISNFFAGSLRPYHGQISYYQCESCISSAVEWTNQGTSLEIHPKIMARLKTDATSLGGCRLLVTYHAIQHAIDVIILISCQVCM